jgi:hypothetical protein
MVIVILVSPLLINQQYYNLVSSSLAVMKGDIIHANVRSVHPECRLYERVSLAPHARAERSNVPKRCLALIALEGGMQSLPSRLCKRT